MISSDCETDKMANKNQYSIEQKEKKDETNKE